jgi:hypothetical protein
MNRILPFIFFLTISLTAQAQQYVQYFDGANTNPNNSIIVTLVPNTNVPNCWQIGPPQKVIFDSAATLPNAIVTDTLNPYPSNDSSAFVFGIKKPSSQGGVMALQWKQKIDFDKKNDGGIVEFSLDSGQTWLNAFTSPYVYKFYGFDTLNHDTLPSGDDAFSGVDSNWRDIWLCFSTSFVWSQDSIAFRFRILTDGVDSSKEGWLIDNIITHMTFVHTVKDAQQTKYLNVYPTATTGIVHIEAEKRNDYHIIEEMALTDASGKVVRRYGLSPTKFWINIADLPPGMYRLKVKTNLKSETFPVILNN